jgi:methyl-accepting chemotaxis protein
LDAINANVLVTDGQGRIVYLNGAMTRLLREIETDIRKNLPDFAVGALLGRDMGVLFEDQSRRQRMREKPAIHRTTVRVGKLTFDLVETPIASPDGILIGVAIELSDASLRLQNLNYAAQANSIGRVRGVVEFDIDGTIVTANELFLKSTGYSLAEHLFAIVVLDAPNAYYRHEGLFGADSFARKIDRCWLSREPR